jgi:hypothetical protein
MRQTTTAYTFSSISALFFYTEVSEMEEICSMYGKRYIQSSGGETRRKETIRETYA